jgi:hypothetical protein
MLGRMSEPNAPHDATTAGRSRRRALFALPVAGLGFLVGCLVRGQYVLASPAPASAARFAGWVTAPRFFVGYFILIGAASTSMFGYSALAGHLGSRIGRAGLVASVVGMEFVVALFGAAVVAQSALGAAFLAGDASAIETATTLFSRGALLGIGASTILNVIGHVLFAIAIWRSQDLPKLSAVTFVLAPIGMLMPFVYPVELTGCALYFASGALLARAGR